MLANYENPCGYIALKLVFCSTLCSSYGLDDQKLGKDHLLPNISDYEQVSQNVFGLHFAIFVAFGLIEKNK